MTTNVVPFAKKREGFAGRTDDELMLVSSAGRRDAFEELVRRHAARVFGFCAKHAGNRASGEEMAQEIWLAVWDHRAAYRAEGKFLGWLFTLARNRVPNARRDGVRHASLVDGGSEVSEATDLSPSELDRLLVVERRARVDRALSHVSATLRDAVLLRFGQELRYEEVARVLETSESTARSRVFHGLRELRRRLGGES